MAVRRLGFKLSVTRTFDDVCRNRRSKGNPMHTRSKLMTTVRATAAAVAISATCFCSVTPAYAWGDLGHEVVGLIASNYLDPAVRTKVNAILTGDTTHLTANTMIDSEATWADKFRDSSSAHRSQTAKWHFVDIEITAPNLTTACFGRPALTWSSSAARACAYLLPEGSIADRVMKIAPYLATLE
jgi:hypothetical protein